MTIAGILLAALTTIMIYFLVINSFQAILLMCAVPELWSHWQLADDGYFHALVGSDALPPISVVAALQRVNTDVLGFAQMLLDLDYPRFEVILVVDGEFGETLRTVIDEFELYEVPAAFTINLKTGPVRKYYRSRVQPRLLCIDKEAGPVGDALNAALNAARYPHTMAAASNVVFEVDALLRLSRPFLLDRSVACVGGVLRPDTVSQAANGWGWAAGCQRVEYLRRFFFQRLGWNRIASNIVFPSGTVLFKREDVFGLGGFDPAEDTTGIDLAVRLHKYLTDTGVNATMPVIPDPVAWTVMPTGIAAIGRARQRWIRGLTRSLSANAVMFSNPEYGAFGMIVMPWLWVGVILAPFLELLGYILLAIGLIAGIIDSSFVWAYLASVVGYGILLSVWTVVFQAISFQREDRIGDIVRLIAFAVMEALGYRQVLAVYRATSYLAERQPEQNRNNG